LSRESSAAQFSRNSLNQCTSGLLLTFQLGGITLGHLGRRHSVNRLQYMQNQDLCILMPHPSNHCMKQVFGKLRIANCQ
jgi:hypothetical protein